VKVNLSTPKILAGLGSLFVALSVIPSIGLLLGLVGWILLLVATHQYSKALSDGEIFKKFLVGSILSLVGFVIALIFGVFGAIGGFIAGSGRGEALGISFGIGFIISFLVAYAFIVYSFYLYKQSFSRIASKIGHGLIGTAGTTLFIGSILLIILVGGLVLFVGWILATVAFFTAPSEIEIIEVKSPETP